MKRICWKKYVPANRSHRIPTAKTRHFSRKKRKYSKRQFSWDEKKKKWVSGGADSMDDVTPDNIRGVFVRFRPCSELRAEMTAAKFFDVTKTLFGGTKGAYDYTEVGKNEQPKP